jgi:hypothetical protein
LLEIAVGAIGLVQGVAVGDECAEIDQPFIRNPGVDEGNGTTTPDAPAPDPG